MWTENIAGPFWNRTRTLVIPVTPVTDILASISYASKGKEWVVGPETFEFLREALERQKIVASFVIRLEAENHRGLVKWIHKD